LSKKICDGLISRDSIGDTTKASRLMSATICYNWAAKGSNNNNRREMIHCTEEGTKAHIPIRKAM